MYSFIILTNQPDSRKSQTCECVHFHKLTAYLVTVKCLSIHVLHFTCQSECWLLIYYLSFDVISVISSVTQPLTGLRLRVQRLKVLSAFQYVVAESRKLTSAICNVKINIIYYP
jgi:hypothetical protein